MRKLLRADLSTIELSASLGCTECESSFNSASLLLKHFAEHISQAAQKDERNEDDFTYEKDVEFAKQSWKKEKNESILEKALRSPSATVTKTGKLSSRLLPLINTTKSSSVVRESISTLSRKCSVFSSPKTYNKNAVLPNSCAKVSGKNVLFEMPKRPKSRCSAIGNVMFVKLDLQKRLENCVLKLVRRDSSLVEESQSAFVDKVNSLQSDQNVSNSVKASEVPNTPNGALTTDRENDTNDVVESPETQDDFNPLKFCVVTLEEGDEKLELNDEEGSSESYSPPPLYELTTCNIVPEKARKPMKCRNDNTKAVAKLKRNTVSNGNGAVKPVTSRKKYPCNYCSKQFGWSTDLKRHILTHTGERPFKCDLCSATFTRNFLLQKHIGKVHTGRIPSTKSTQDGKSEIVNPALTVQTCPSDTIASEIQPKLLNGDGMRDDEGAVYGGLKTLLNGEYGADCNGMGERLQTGKVMLDSEVVNGQKDTLKGMKPKQSRKKRKVTSDGLDDDELRRRKKKKKKKLAGILHSPLGALVPISSIPLHTLEGLNAKDPL
ncbi:hypothetical protein J437_LFUL005878 [Ladona fulva]|uniref:C2H2-type domain-containing protein n=1 Tax=Ladona fulva TaxID=123851 RepID=A0A8K0K8P4_LADFU|nr:hypothetical protein J437_LFUL005878 [Ladona fulva]